MKKRIKTNNEKTNEPEIIERPFVPISGIDEMGVVDFLVRFYKPDEKTNFQGGVFSKLLDQLKVNENNNDFLLI